MRRALLESIPEQQLATKLLDAASDAVLLENMELAGELIVLSDMQGIMDYAIKVVGPLSLEVHRQTNRPTPIRKSERDPTRMPPQSVQHEIFGRDGWHCRFCGIPVISKKARAYLIKRFPNQTRWQNKEYERHSALYSMAASLDHVVPHSRGGKNSEENFVTACYCCQFGRGELTLQESELEDPRDFEPIITAWDGLVRLENA